MQTQLRVPSTIRAPAVGRVRNSSSLAAAAVAGDAQAAWEAVPASRDSDSGSRTPHTVGQAAAACTLHRDSAGAAAASHCQSSRCFQVEALRRNAATPGDVDAKRAGMSGAIRE